MWLAEFKIAWRHWRRRPLEAILVVAVLALGIGLSGTVWSAAWGTLWRGLETEGGSRLVRLAIANAEQPAHRATLPPEVFEAIDRRLASCDRLGAWLPFAVDVGGLDRFPERLNGAMVTAGTLEMLGVEPLLGRFFSPEEERRQAPVVIVGERLWREQLGGDASVLGRSIEVYRQPRTIIGVVAEGVRAPYNQELWYPFDAEVAQRSPWLQVLGRLAPDATPAHVEAELAPVARQYAPEGRVIVDAFEGAYFDPALRRSLHVALVAVAALLLVACANAAGLFLAQGPLRRNEMAVRHALGAGRGRLLRQLVVESSLLVAAAGALGLSIAALGISLYNRTDLVQGPYWIDVRLDPVVVAFVLVLTFAVGSLASLWPSWRLSSGSLRAGRAVVTSRETATWHRALVVLQVSMAVALIAGTWWIVSAAEVLSEPYEKLWRDDLVTLQTSVYSSRHAESFELAQAFWDRLLVELADLPGVESAVLAPVAGRWGGEVSATVEGRSGAPDSTVRALAPLVSPGAFDVLAAPPLLGRDLRPEESRAREVALVDRVFADRYLGSDPLGRRVRLGEDKPWRRVVGVVPDLAIDELAQPRPSIYVPAQSAGGTTRTVVLQTGPDTALAGLETAVRQAVARVDPQVGVYWVKPMSEFVELELRHVHRVQLVFRVFGAMATLLTAAGLYGALALAVASRGRELAVRQALGATRGDLRRGVLASGLRQVGMGSLLGSVLAWWTLRLLASIFGDLSDVSWVLLPTGATLLAMAVLAASAPAHRAGAVDPALAVREQ